MSNENLIEMIFENPQMTALFLDLFDKIRNMDDGDIIILSREGNNLGVATPTCCIEVVERIVED